MAIRPGVHQMITSRKADKCEEAADELRALDLPGQVDWRVSHVGDPQTGEKAMEETVDRFGSFDVLVNNAATNPHNGRTIDVPASMLDKTYEVNDQKKSVLIGRADDNDLVIKGNLISRIHAKVEMRRGKFLLIDQSTNGTFLQNLLGEELFVRRDSTELRGEGTIGLGRAEAPGSSLSIHYKAME